MIANKLTYVTTCKARLSHLKQSLPAVAAQPNIDIVVVDYDCPEGTAAWVKDNFPQVRVVRIFDEPGFNLAKARNAGGAEVKTQWVAFFDADIVVHPDFAARTLPLLQERHFYRAWPLSLQRWGSVICEATAFKASGGYDTVYKGWGVEDDDFYMTLGFLGHRTGKFDGNMISEVSHSNAERTRFYDVTKFQSHQTNQIYRQAKLDLMRLSAGLLPEPTRQALYNQINAKMSERRASGRNTLEVDITLPVSMIEGPDIVENLGRRPRTKIERKLFYSIDWEAPSVLTG